MDDKVQRSSVFLNNLNTYLLFSRYFSDNASCSVAIATEMEPVECRVNCN